jgi:3-deoxy-manno-octulosonate cytidylyltransferase (CMP-KDO synthetase)
MDFTVVIPARYDSSRLPGKPLMDIAGMTMIQRVYVQAKKSNATQVVVATDDQRIFDHVESFDGQVCMTSEYHQSGTDRLQEVTKKLGLPEDHIVVNVQGDEPLMPPEVIDQVANNLSVNLLAGVATLCEPISNKCDFNSPHVVKVVADQNSLAMFFSRAPIPYRRDEVAYDTDIANASFKSMRHVGIYAYRVSMLNQFVCWPVAPIEKVELLEQLRFLWNGEKIHVDQSVKHVPGGIDTQEDLEYAVRFLEKLS